jgi:hypothetical protein
MVTLRCDPPPLKWSDLRYVFDIKAASVGQRGTHALGIDGLGDRTDRPIRSDPLARGMGERGGQMDHAGGLIDGGRL